MDVSIKERWKPFVDELVQTGRYDSVDEIADEGFRLVQAREAKLAALRDTIETSIARGGTRTDEQVTASLNETAARLAAEGY